VLWIIPRLLRDIGYRFVARYRYAIFGKKDACRMPGAAERERFLP
jgi:predicted DCC family thiol-disulfide oxidoreductase YuxK